MRTLFPSRVKVTCLVIFTRGVEAAFLFPLDALVLPLVRAMLLIVSLNVSTFTGFGPRRTRMQLSHCSIVLATKAAERGLLMSLTGSSASMMH